MGYQIGFIGGGNMADAIIARMVQAGWTGSSIHVVDKNKEKLVAMQERYSATVHEAFGPWIGEMDAVLLAVKPQQLGEVLRDIRTHLTNALVISIAAGFETKDLMRLADNKRVIRCMPNTPVRIGEGVCGLYATEAANNPEDHKFAVKVFACCGEVIWCDDEAMLEGITAVSGSGPAYVFRFIEALETAAKRYGFNEAQASRLAVATVLGAAKLAKNSTDSAATLRAKVTSKGGTTYEALKVMDDHHFIDMMQEAMDACKKRSRELGEAFGKNAQ